MVRRRIGIGAVVLCSACTAAGAWYGCSIYDSSLLLPASEGGDAAVDAGDDSDADRADPCALAHAPRPPAAGDPSGGDVEILAASHFIDLGLPNDAGIARLLGYDLDGVNTCCRAAPESCSARTANATHCDLEGGIDNSGGALIRTLAQLGGKALDPATVNQRIDKGQYTLLVRVRGYNGQANDTKVELSVYVSDGIAPDDAGSTATPAWDGTDTWTVDSNSVLFGGNDGGPLVPNFVDANAYVVSHVLVASLDFPIELGATTGQSFSIQLTGTVITGTLTQASSGWKIDDGQFAGRWSTPKLLASLGGIRLSSGGYICPGTSFYQNAKTNFICPAVDIALDRSDDGKAKPCSALSMGFGFAVVPARFGPVVTKPVGPSTCPDAGAQPDDCP